VVGLKKHPDSNDSMGTFAVMEAMASGKVVVATHTNSLESYIEDGVTGVFVPPYDARALHHAICELWNDEEKRTRIGARAREFAVQYADAELFAKRLADFFKALVAKPKKR
jgi:glycosyltransferase involved in cell wall biosynthesis